MKQDNITKEELDAFCINFGKSNTLDQVKKVYWELYTRYGRKLYKNKNHKPPLQAEF